MTCIIKQRNLLEKVFSETSAAFHQQSPYLCCILAWFGFTPLCKIGCGMIRSQQNPDGSKNIQSTHPPRIISDSNLLFDTKTAQTQFSPKTSYVEMNLTLSMACVVWVKNIQEFSCNISIFLIWYWNTFGAKTVFLLRQICMHVCRYSVNKTLCCTLHNVVFNQICNLEYIFRQRSKQKYNYSTTGFCSD